MSQIIVSNKKENRRPEGQVVDFKKIKIVGDSFLAQSITSDWESKAVGLIVRSNRTESEPFMRRKLALNEERIALNERRLTLNETKVNS